MVGATRTTVCQTVRTLGVVQGDGVSELTGTPLNDAGHLTACSWFGFAQEEQGVPAGAFMIVRRRFVTAPEFFNAQMGSDLYGFDLYSLAHFCINRRPRAAWNTGDRCSTVPKMPSPFTPSLRAMPVKRERLNPNVFDLIYFQAGKSPALYSMPGSSRPSCISNQRDTSISASRFSPVCTPISRSR